MGDLRYADAGVDIDAGNRAIDLIRKAVASTHTSSVLGGIGAFSGLFELDVTRWKRPVLVSSTDSVGTKVKVAIATGRHRGIGVDLVNHCVNDILCCGAQPLFFLDYYATGKLVPEHLAELVDGVAAACRDAGCALVGGETAEMPGVYALGDYDIAGFIVGAVERDGIVDGSRVEAGDVLLAMPSSGLHTNGYSLVRHIVLKRELDWNAALPGTDAPLADLLLEPHRCYLHAVDELRAVGRRACHGAHHRRRAHRERAARAPARPQRGDRPGQLGRARALHCHRTRGRGDARGDVAHLQHGRRHGARRAAGAS